MKILEQTLERLAKEEPKKCDYSKEYRQEGLRSKKVGGLSWCHQGRPGFRIFTFVDKLTQDDLDEILALMKRKVYVYRRTSTENLYYDIWDLDGNLISCMIDSGEKEKFSATRVALIAVVEKEYPREEAK